MKIKERLRENFPVYREDAAALAIAEEAVKHFQNQGLQRYEDIVEHFLTEGRMEFRGFEAKDAHQIALLMQVFRNVNLETFRIIYMRDDCIAAMSGIESRMPHIAYTMAEKNARKEYYRITERMQRLGADGYYLVHNHPTGEVKPSYDDQDATARFSLIVPGFRGHIILDHDRYSLLNRNGIMVGEYPITPKYQNPLWVETETYLIGTKIRSLSDFTGFIDHLNPHPERSVLIYCDSGAKVRYVDEIPDKAILNDRNFANYLRNEMTRQGCPIAFLGTENEEVYNLSCSLVEKRYLRNAVYMDGIGIEQALDTVLVDTSVIWAGKTDAEILSRETNSGRIAAPQETKSRLFIDMDGTLAKFRVVDTMETLYEEGYFAELPPQQKVVDGIKQFMKENPETEVFILSSVLSDSPYAMHEKEAWIDRYLPEIDREHRIFCPCGSPKGEYVPYGARHGDVLIDDYSKNLHEWEGVGVKLMNGINGTHGSWKGAKLQAEGNPDEIAEEIHKIMQAPKTKDLTDTNKRRLRR